MNRILLLSDIHANLAALEAVLLDAARTSGFNEVWTLGDTVGYGPRPNECLDRLRELAALSVTGNHELAAIGSISLDDFNPYARAAAEWTAGVLTNESKTYIDSLPDRREIRDFTLVHGSPRSPIWEYVTDPDVAVATAGYLNTPHCLNGHTHVPAAIPAAQDPESSWWAEHGEVVEIGAGRWFVNPGSVGQPRDGDSRASYAVLDKGAMSATFFRVKYPIDETQHQMEAVGLPDILVKRLAAGR